MSQSNLPATLQFGAYTLVKELGKGGEGVVALYKKTIDGSKYAVKFEFHGVFNNTMLSEALFLKDATALGLDRIPKYELHGTIGGRKFFIMEYLSESIDDYIQSFV